MSEHLERRMKALVYHEPSAEVHEAMRQLRGTAQALVALVDAHLPECREKSLAFTALEEAMMWAMKALTMTAAGGEAAH